MQGIVIIHSANYSYVTVGEGATPASWSVIYSQDQTVKISLIGPCNRGEVTLNVPYKARSGISDSISVYALNNSSVWGVDANINNGLPYIKDFYWKHSAISPSKG